MKIAIWLLVILLVGGTFAGPVILGTKKSVEEAKSLIEELIGSETTSDELVAMAAETDKGAERYWLYMYAFIRNAKSGNNAEAVEVLEKLYANVTGIVDADVVAFVEKSARKVLAGDNEVSRYIKGIKARIAAQKSIIPLASKVRKNPNDESLRSSLVEAQAVAGDWAGALKTLSESKGDGAAAAKAELSKKPTVRAATFWWNYKPGRTYSGSKVFKRHAAELYKSLLDGGKLTTLDRTLAEKRLVQYTEAEGELPGSVEKAAPEVNADLRVVATPKGSGDSAGKTVAKGSGRTVKNVDLVNPTQMFYLGNTGYNSFEDVIADAKDGDTILVGESASFSASKLNCKSITFDLCGRKLTWEAGGYVTKGSIAVVDSSASAGRLVLDYSNRNYQTLVDMSALKGEQLSGPGMFWTGAGTHVVFPSDMTKEACLKFMANKVDGARIVVQGVTYTSNGTNWER